MAAAGGADSIAAIPEEDASGDIATLYADLRATLGVPFVNLIWRHLATIQGGLAWAWTLVKPLYVIGASRGPADACGNRTRRTEANRVSCRSGCAARTAPAF